MLTTFRLNVAVSGLSGTKKKPVTGPGVGPKQGRDEEAADLRFRSFTATMLADDLGCTVHGSDKILLDFIWVCLVPSLSFGEFAVPIFTFCARYTVCGIQNLASLVVLRGIGYESLLRHSSNPNRVPEVVRWSCLKLPKGRSIHHVVLASIHPGYLTFEVP